ncbi:MAG: recombinase family protein, partial [Actinomycetota bacterium]|nr:recombinase family protein [Actinomycetota bacterium]
ADLVEALREKGLTTRKTPSRPERDVSYNSLLSMLRNPYYMGVLTYQAVTYQGQHLLADSQSDYGRDVLAEEVAVA